MRALLSPRDEPDDLCRQGGLGKFSDLELLVEDQAEGGIPVWRLLALCLLEQSGERGRRGYLLCMLVALCLPGG